MRKFTAYFVVFAVLGTQASKGAATTFQGVGIYQSFDQFTAWAQQFAAANPDLVNVVQYGRSYQDRPLLALQITQQPGGNNHSKPEFLFTGGIHAGEVIGSQAMYQLAEQLVGGYRSGGSAFLDILSEREVWIMPDLNPDGRIAVEGGNNSKRTNMQGVDLNRNFPHRWQDAPSYRGDTYRGPSVLSTPEDSALWALLHNSTSFDHLLGAIDFHSGTQLIISPWTSRTEFRDYPLPAADRAKFDYLADQMSQRTGIVVARLSYDTYGTLADSLYEEFGTKSFIEEIFTGPSSDTFSFFNPLDIATRDDAVNHAVNSALYLLSDDAFYLVPEPSNGLLMTLWAAALFLLGKRIRTGATLRR